MPASWGVGGKVQQQAGGVDGDDDSDSDIASDSDRERGWDGD